MRWGDDGAGGGDDVGDDPDDARCDGDDDGDDFPLQEGISPADFSLPETFFSLSGFHLAEAVEKQLSVSHDDFRSEGRCTLKGAIGTRGGSHPQPRTALPPGQPLWPIFGLLRLFLTKMTSLFFWNFRGFGEHVS